MSIEIVRDSLVIRSWSETDAEGLAGAVADSLDHIRPWPAGPTAMRGRETARMVIVKPTENSPARTVHSTHHS